MPIPTIKYESIDCYMMQYDISSPNGYKNLKMNIKIKDSERVYTFREVIQEKYGVDLSSYVMVWVEFQ